MPTTIQETIIRALESGSWLVFFTIFWSGAILSLSSCTIVRVPIVIGYVGGAATSKKRAFFLTVYIDSTSDSQKAKGYGGTHILVSLNPDAAPREFLDDDYDDFTEFLRMAPVSPDKKYRLIQTEEKDIPLVPGDPGFGMDLRPKMTVGSDALYLEKKTLGSKIKI